jgi:hypothetical protein
MLIREKLNKHSKLISSVVLIISITCLSVAWTRMRGPSHHFVPGPNYYTTDDSSQAAALAAMFKDDSTKIPPFDHDGKPAFRAYVFTADGGRTKWIAYLERMSDKGLQMMDDINSGKRGSDPGIIAQAKEGVLSTQMEVKKPGDPEWIKEVADSPDAARVRKLTPPDGQSLANVQSVFP